MQLGLGTVQFGLPYGINNSAGKTLEQECAKVFSIAKNNNISFIDTAYGYGDAHSIIGQNTSSIDSCKIITKISISKNQYIDSKDIIAFKNILNTSLFDMKRKYIYALLFHDAKDLFKPGSDQIIKEIKLLKAQGIIEKIGVSLYDDKLIESLISLNLIDIIQVPINILDQRLILSGQLEKLHNHGIEIHARSIFLQGLLLQNPIEINSYFKPVKEKLIKLNSEAKTRGITVLELLLGFIKGVSFIDVAIIGVNNAIQLKEIINSIGIDINPEELSYLAVEEECFVNPSKWQINAN